MVSPQYQERVKRRLNEQPLPNAFYPNSPHYMLAAWEVLIDILLGSVHHDRMDLVIEKVQEGTASGEPTVAGMQRLMNEWTVSKALGRTNSIAHRVSDNEILDLIRSSKVLAVMLDDQADEDLSKVLVELSAQGQALANTLNAMLISARKDEVATRRDREPAENIGLTQVGEGSWVASASDAQRFTSDGKFEELKSILSDFISDLQPATGSLRTSSQHFPSQWNTRIEEAVQLKRRGSFLDSGRIYINLCRNAGVAYAGILLPLYKTVASAGDLLGANTLIFNAFAIYDRNPGPIADSVGPGAFQDHLDRLVESSKSEPELERYLRDLSGNVNYRLPRDYLTMVGELRRHYASLNEGLARLNAANKRAGAGCYIATAVYGSYDAQPVVALRRFRDDRLARSASGRALIRLYYALSPSLARHFEEGTLLNRWSRRALNAIVNRINRSTAPGSDSDRLPPSRA